MKKNTIVILATVVIFLIIGVAYYYENYIVLKDEILYPEAINILKTDVNGAITYCKMNTTIDKSDGGGACLAEIACEAYKMGDDKVQELCENIVKDNFQENTELQKSVQLCVKQLSIICGNKEKAMELCESDEHKSDCFISLALVVANQDIQTASQLCKKVDIMRKDECYFNVLYAAIKRGKIDDGLMICDVYDNDMTKSSRDNNMSEYFKSRKDYCYLFFATHTLETDYAKAKEICNNIQDPEIKESCLNRTAKL